MEVGDVLHSQWGYDQTNNDYYEVTKVLGKNKVEIREIGSGYEETGFMSGQSTPIAGMYVGEPMTKIARNGAVKVRSFAHAYLMKPKTGDNGKPVFDSSYESSYA